MRTVMFGKNENEVEWIPLKDLHTLESVAKKIGATVDACCPGDSECNMLHITFESLFSTPKHAIYLGVDDHCVPEVVKVNDEYVLIFRKNKETE